MSYLLRANCTKSNIDTLRSDGNYEKMFRIVNESDDFIWTHC